MHTVLFTEHFQQWFESLTVEEQDSVLYGVQLLRQEGYLLNRPHADTITNSNLSNLKELRIQHDGKPYRAFFIFDPLRQAIVLCGGNKTGSKRFYKKMIPLAEKIYAEYLAQMEQPNETDQP